MYQHHKFKVERTAHYYTIGEANESLNLAAALSKLRNESNSVLAKRIQARLEWQAQQHARNM